MTQPNQFPTKDAARAWARRLYGSKAKDGDRYSILRISDGRFMISDNNYMTEEGFKALWQRLEDSDAFPPDPPPSNPNLSSDLPETTAKGDMMLPPATQAFNPEPDEDTDMAKKPKTTTPKASAPKATAAPKFAPPSPHDTAEDKAKVASERARAAQAVKEDKARLAAEAKAAKEAEKAAKEKSLAEAKALREKQKAEAKAAKGEEPAKVAKVRTLSPKMQAMLDLAQSEAGLTHKEIVEITGMGNPPQTQLVERLRAFVGGTVRKVKADGARGFTYFVDGPANPVDEAEAENAEVSGDQEIEGDGTGEAADPIDGTEQTAGDQPAV